MRHNVSQVLQPYLTQNATTRLVIAVSGGADSLALLHVLYTLAEALRLTLHVATLDHGLRGEAGADDAQFVVDTAQAWGLPVTAGKVALDPHAPGLEARARAARYAFLAEVARNVGATYIIVAQHADDQAETVLMRLLRGTGTSGLAGMRVAAPLPGANDLTLLRPLLSVTRAEIDAYCVEHHLQPRQDATNTDLTYLRNRIRLETLPYLRRLNPQVTQALNRLAQIAADEDSYIEAELARLTHGHMQTTAGRITLDRARFRDMPPALGRRFILNTAHQLGGEPDYDHVVAAAALAQHGKLGDIALLGDGLRVRVDYQAIAIEHQDAPFVSDLRYTLPPGAEIPVTVPGDTPTPAGWVLRTLYSVPQYSAPENAESVLSIRIPADAKITLRTRRPGDRFAPPNLKGQHKKLKKVMIDLKIPKYLRDNVPLMIINANIVAMLLNRQWIVAHGFMFDLTVEREPEGRDDSEKLNQLVFFLPTLLPTTL